MPVAFCLVDLHETVAEFLDLLPLRGQTSMGPRTPLTVTPFSVWFTGSSPRLRRHWCCAACHISASGRGCLGSSAPNEGRCCGDRETRSTTSRPWGLSAIAVEMPSSVPNCGQRPTFSTLLRDRPSRAGESPRNGGSARSFWWNYVDHAGRTWYDWSVIRITLLIWAAVSHCSFHFAGNARADPRG